MAGGPLTPEPATDTSRRRSVDDTAQVARLRWGAIWAGVLIALTAFLLLELLVFGISLVSAADRPGNSRDEDWVSGIIGLIAFFIGGYAASKASAAEDMSAARNARAGLLDGLLVWALGSVLILTLSALRAGQIFGALGDVVGQSCALGDPTTTIEPSRIAGTIRSSAVGAFFTLLLWALASAIEGWLADRTGRTAVGRASIGRGGY